MTARTYVFNYHSFICKVRVSTWRAKQPWAATMPMLNAVPSLYIKWDYSKGSGADV